MKPAYFASMTLPEKKRFYKSARKAYYNDQPVITDAQFDQLEDMIKEADPNWKELAKTGVAVDKKKKAKLREPMPSLYKQYPHEVEAWLTKHSKTNLILDKLDGSALQLTLLDGKPKRLVTRGDGTVGGDISFLIPYLKLPKQVKHKGYLDIRCEGVLETKKFKARWEGNPKSDKGKFENPRNMVNGLFNRMKPHPALGEVSIVVLGVYGYSLMEGLMLANKLGFETVRVSLLSHVNKNKKYLTELLNARRKSSAYDMDGLVLADGNKTLQFETADKPKWMTAFKENSADNVHDVKVKEIIWQTSGNSRLIPKARIQATRIGGVEVSNVTLHNAAWMMERPMKDYSKFPGRKLMIGPGAIIQVVRSGDVIPKVVGVVKGGKFQPPEVPYKQKGVHFVEAKESALAQTRRVARFFSTLGIENIALTTIRKCHAAGMETVPQYLQQMTLPTPVGFYRAGVGKAMSAKIVKDMKRVLDKGLTLKQWMVASSAFGAGLGDRKLQMVLDAYPNDPNILLKLLNERNQENIWALLQGNVPGWSSKTIDLFIKGLIPFRAWLKPCVKYVKIKPEGKAVKKVKIKGLLSGQVITFTSYRNEEHEAYVRAQGGEVAAFSAKTTILLYKEGGKQSSKIEKAKAKGIQVLTFDQLKKRK